MTQAPTLLLVDDERPICRVLKRMLTGAGYRVALADSGEKALELAAERGFDAALVDYWMPPPNGLQVLRKLRRQQPDCVRLIMTGAFETPAVSAATRRGDVNGVIKKPFSEHELKKMLSDSLNKIRESSSEKKERKRSERAVTRRQINECLDDNSFELAVQPIVQADGLRVVAQEALLRSRHAILRTPSSVFQAAETASMVDRVADFVVRRAAEWLAWTPADQRLFLNLHETELWDLESLTARFASLSKWADRTVLDLPQQVSLFEMNGNMEALHLLKDMGFAISLDNVGVGSDSLAAMGRLKPQFAKVDMSIVRNINNELPKRRLAELMARFANATGVALIAEGVETRAEAQTLWDCGARLLQGYLYGRPAIMSPLI